MRPAATLLCALFLACSSDSPRSSAPTQALFVVPSSLDELSAEHFWDHPWPSDLRRDADGSIHMKGLYNPHQVILIDDYVNATAGLIPGFSPAAGIYLRFTASIDPSSLPPSPRDTVDAKAAVQIVDVDSKSPERGKRKLAQLFYREEDGVYWLAHTLAVMPALGYPLRPSTRYAVVVTRAAKDITGAPVSPSADLEEVMGARPASDRTKAAHDLFAPALAELQAANIQASDIAHLTVFTTSDPASELFRVVDDVRASVPAPTVPAGSWKATDSVPTYDVYEGQYGPSPNYQHGNLPFAKEGDGGGFAFDASGKPTLANTFNLRFALVVPKASACPMPAAGYPIVLYAHGTGGDYRSIIEESNAIGDGLAQKCVASMGIDQIFHGTRPGAPPATDPNRESEIELLFFNLINIVAARTNSRQAAVDVVQQARLFTESHIAVPAQTSRTNSAISFDARSLGYFGHSQGSLNGALYLAADDSARGGVLSGSGNMLTIALLEKTQPSPSIAQLVKTLLQLTSPDDAAELTVFHPVLNMAQTMVDVIDPVHYMGYVAQHPRTGRDAKSLLITEGIAVDGTGDSYAPPHGIEVGSVAAGVPRIAPGVRPIVEAGFGDLADVSAPVSANLASGKATGALSQWPPAAGHDGHFVVFDVPQAHAQAMGFCQMLTTGALPAIR
jgi:hypothetical protein